MNTNNHTSENKSNHINTVYSTFAVLFYINRQKIKQNGMRPLMGRISINAEVAQFSARIDIDPSLWDSKVYRMTSKSRYAAETNYHIEQLTDRINRYYKQILDE
ncbi:MAG: hypothetical protein LBC81_00740 [Tannerellaceae bacterium]|jgi:hypothetical protein|nr:hypothetical protein [Tannerellaceae bacterium]